MVLCAASASRTSPFQLSDLCTLDPCLEVLVPVSTVLDGVRVDRVNATDTVRNVGQGIRGALKSTVEGFGNRYEILPKESSWGDLFHGFLYQIEQIVDMLTTPGSSSIVGVFEGRCLEVWWMSSSRR